MLWIVLISVLIALGILVMMYDEISTGFYRWRDYIVTTILLYSTGALLVFLADLLPEVSGTPFVFLLFIKALLSFGLMIMVWGGTLTLGSLIVRIFGYKKQA